MSARHMREWARRLRATPRRARYAAAFVLCAVVLAWLRCGPLPAGLLDAAAAGSTVVFDRHGVELYEALGAHGTRTARLSAATIPPLVAGATVAAEDHRFWSHPGVDPLAVARAIRVNLVERSLSEGASTITQQTAKMLLDRRHPGRRRGWAAKLHEAVVALRLEHRLPKPEILALYLNLAAYGNQITGYERASQAYFGVPSAMLTAAQAAFLAGLPQRPSAFNPYRHEALAMSRQRAVLRRMAAAGVLTPGQAADASRERLTLERAARPFLAPHFAAKVLAGMGAAKPPRIDTTLDAGLQADVAGIIAAHRPALRRHGAANVAVAVLDNARGEWLAWEGSGDYLDAEHGGAIDGVTTPRQPGSALKPFTYALAFERGFTPASVLPDVPLHFPTADEGIVYTPRNYDNRYRGPLLARAALAGSENVPAVALAADLGVPALLRFLHGAGFSTFDRTAAHYGLGMTLGNAEVRLDELVTAYAAFARGGIWMPARAVRDSSSLPSRRLVSERTAFWIADILADDAARAYAFGRGTSLEFPFPVAVKTGTSQAYHDNWAIAFTRGFTVGVWVGNFDRRPLRNSSGVTGAAPIMQAVVLATQRRTGAPDERLAHPGAALAPVEVCALSGEAAGEACPARRREWLPEAGASRTCAWHQRTAGGVATVWPAPYREWAAREHGGTRPLPPHAVGLPRARPAAARRAPDAAAQPALHIVNPPSDGTYLLDPTLRREYQTLPLRVVAEAPTTVRWSVDGVFLGTSSSDAPLDWPLRAGRHRISATDEHGRTAESVITVR